MTEICDIPYPIYDLTKNSKPCSWPEPYIKILFHTWCFIFFKSVDCVTFIHSASSSQSFWSSRDNGDMFSTLKKSNSWELLLSLRFLWIGKLIRRAVFVYLELKIDSEKMKWKWKWIIKIKNIYYQFAILDKQKQFYESIYQSRENVTTMTIPKSPFFQSRKHIPIISRRPKTLWRRSWMYKRYAINGFKKDKTPGTDGFSVEFTYSTNFSGPGFSRAEMLSSFHFAFQTGSLSISQCRGVISLISKKTKTNHY